MIGWRARRLSAAALVLLLLSACRGAAPSAPPAAPAFVPVSAEDQLSAMHRGMNVLDEDPLWDDPAAALFQPRHFARLRDAGFDTVRINLHPFVHSDASGQIDPTWLATLDGLVKAALDDGLTVILDEHDDSLCERDVAACGPRLRAVWEQLAGRYRHAPNRLLFEILNEPHDRLTAAVWNDMLRDLLATVRATNPQRNVVIGPAGWNAVDQLKTLDLPADDPHIIVTVHYYRPVRFTHQGARWVAETANLSGITWGTDAEMAQLVKDFDAVRAWADAQHRPMLLGEFGAYDKADMASRVRYISAVARVAEAHGFPWAYWQFDSDFTAYDIRRDDWVRPILQALVPP